MVAGVDFRVLHEAAEGSSSGGSSPRLLSVFIGCIHQCSLGLEQQQDLKTCSTATAAATACWLHSALLACRPHLRPALPVLHPHPGLGPRLLVLQRVEDAQAPTGVAPAANGAHCTGRRVARL